MYEWPDEPFEEMDSTLAVQQVKEQNYRSSLYQDFDNSQALDAGWLEFVQENLASHFDQWM